ncbi:LysE family translocator [Thalassospira sp. MCCC 1A03138]|uniref:LysE family translocator n=1 Tax=Thalassospira sp. MCCC 1A03138 TaxID=1470576 RepID=UPI000A1E7A67|nr:LysE family translocator [Thalassospira sp. MCCC 1A03138]OSQ32099.1 hypothetical protein TH468_00040 [Thalassospira sp. MCCC 1A03138]
MEYVPYLLTAYAIFAMAVMSPGPNFLAVTSASMTVSRRAGLGIALGIGTGTICWSTMTVIGLTAILAASEEVAIALRWIGGGYLIYMGFMSLRSAYKSRGQGLEVPVSDAKADRPLWRYVRRGLLVQMSNPKAALFWFSIMSIVLRPDAPGWVGLAIVLGTTTFSFGWHLVLASGAGVVLFNRGRHARLSAGLPRHSGRDGDGVCFAGRAVDRELNKTIFGLIILPSEDASANGSTEC